MVEFTKRAKRVINEMAQEEAKRLGHDFVGPEHVFLGLLKEEDSVAVKILINLNINLNELRKDVERKAREENLMLDLPSSQDRYQKVVEGSREEAKRMKHNYIGTEHILLALLRDNNNIAAGVLSTYSVNYNVIKSEILRLLGVSQVGTVGVSSSSGSQQQSQACCSEITQCRGQRKMTQWRVLSQRSPSQTMPIKLRQTALRIARKCR